MIPHFFRFPGYDTSDIRTSIKDKTCTIYLERRSDKAFNCYRCGCFLQRNRGRYPVRLEHLSIMGFKTYLHFWREKGECANCKKARAEHVEFIARETPHMTQDYAWWIGRMCEFAAVSRVAEFLDLDNMTVRRVDLARMQRMLQHYKIPEVTHISVDEVYARNKGAKGESRDDRFFTVITDLKTRRVIWVAESRSKRGLDEFFRLIGPGACKKIVVVAMDQHDPYKASVKEHCPKAKVVWDRFHLVQSFNEAFNEDRKQLHEASRGDSISWQLTRSRFKYLFLKREKKRSESERQHIQQAMKANEWLLQMELIKERFLSFFDEQDVDAAWDIFDELGDWISECAGPHLKRWYKNLEAGWDTLANYFSFKVTSAVSEGINNVIKSLKRRAFGYRNMNYFRLKIMQVCGYLNSQYIRNVSDLNSNLRLSQI